MIGTGPAAGTYFPVGGAICSVFNQARGGQGPRCLVEATAGSQDNLLRLTRGEIDFALVQSDWQYLASHGGQVGELDKADNLRAVFSLQAHAITIVANPSAGITALDDLKGRRVNLGPSGSGTRAAAEAFVAALAWSRADLGEILELPPADLAAALCEGRIDAFILPVNHPDGIVAAATALCSARLLEVPARVIDRISREWPFYAPARVPPGIYRGQDQAVRSYGVRATLVTMAKVSEDTVFALTDAVFSNLAALKGQHPVLGHLTREEMIGVGFVLETHKGAARYFGNAGR